MRFLCTFAPDPKSGAAHPSAEQMAEMNAFVEELTRQGVLVATGGFRPGDTGFRVRASRGEFSVMDGPFAESKELIGGFALLEVKSREEAVAFTRRFLKLAGDGESELRQLMDPSDTCPQPGAAAVK